MEEERSRSQRRLVSQPSRTQAQRYSDSDNSPDSAEGKDERCCQGTPLRAVPLTKVLLEIPE